MLSSSSAILFPITTLRPRGHPRKPQSDEGLEGVIVEALKEEMEEETDDTMSVFVDAKRLRKCVIVEIVGALSVHSSGSVF